VTFSRHGVLLLPCVQRTTSAPPISSFSLSHFRVLGQLSTQSFSPALAEYQKRDHAGNKDRDDRNG
jgi:hypothetical protein